MGALSLLVGLLPVVLFLATLLFLDSYKLVTRRDIFRSILAGVAAALLAYFANAAAFGTLGLDPAIVKRYVAPVIEECAKAVLVVYVIRAGKVGFMVDAGIHGFAIGTGFALVENVYYAWSLGTSSLGLWIVRGLGTAILHGSTTAVVGILSKDLTDRHDSRSLRWFLPGLGLAVIVHSLYNHVLVNPLLAALLLLVAVPALVVVVFERSERATRDWLGIGLDSDMERLELILSGDVPDTPLGEYLESLKHRFTGPVVGDMLCLMRIQLELSMRAKGMLIARAAGVSVEIDEHVRANLEELRFLEKAIGPTGQLAITPFLRTSSRDLWQIYMLRQ
jgi:RsiW-degrading membrane proteinase PrsW (M82 family)